MKIINAKVYTEAGIFEEKDVYTDGELIAEKSGDDQVLDAKNLLFASMVRSVRSTQ